MFSILVDENVPLIDFVFLTVVIMNNNIYREYTHTLYVSSPQRSG